MAYRKTPDPAPDPPEISARRRMMLEIEEHARRCGECRVSIRGRLWDAGSGCLSRRVGSRDLSLPLGDLTEHELGEVVHAFRMTRTPVDPRRRDEQAPKLFEEEIL